MDTVEVRITTQHNTTTTESMIRYYDEETTTPTPQPTVAVIEEWPRYYMYFNKVYRAKDADDLGEFWSNSKCWCKSISPPPISKCGTLISRDEAIQKGAVV